MSKKKHPPVLPVPPTMPHETAVPQSAGETPVPIKAPSGRAAKLYSVRLSERGWPPLLVLTENREDVEGMYTAHCTIRSTESEILVTELGAAMRTSQGLVLPLPWCASPEPVNIAADPYFDAQTQPDREEVPNG